MTVRVVFTRKRQPFSALLRAFLWSRWSHVAIIDGDEVIDATGENGVSVRSLSQLLGDASEHEIVDIPAADPRAVIAAARAQVGKPYDWLGVLGIGFRRRWQNDTSWFCSELVAHAFAAGGSPLVRVEAWRITPRDLYLPLYWPAKPAGA